MARVLGNAELRLTDSSPHGKTTAEVSPPLVTTPVQAIDGQPQYSRSAAFSSSRSSEAFSHRRVPPSDDAGTLEQHRRYVTLHERLFHSRLAHLVAGWFIAVVLPALWQWGWGFWHSGSLRQWATLAGTTLAFLVALATVQQLSRLPRTRPELMSAPSLALCYGLLFWVFEVAGITHDLGVIVVSGGVAAAYCTIGYVITAPYRRLRLAVVPFGRADEFCHEPRADWCFLQSPSLEGLRVDGVVVDLRTALPAAWQGFLSDCTLHRIPVYHVTDVFERLTGRVHLQDNRLGSFQPDEGYEVLKRMLDLLGVMLLLPVVLPLMAITALAIRLESPGPVLFTQPRMGLHCRPFCVYKFRSMWVDHQGAGFTQDGCDPRITRVGRVIRKFRIDELPQLFNVLKGDMSLIGPRPESLGLTNWYKDDVPYFHYRHVVRPGISGWAQVEQGYAAEVDGMTRKLEYDFYYIKNVSLWLDLLIVIRTIRAVLTGFGSR